MEKLFLVKDTAKDLEVITKQVRELMGAPEYGICSLSAATQTAIEVSNKIGQNFGLREPHSDRRLTFPGAVPRIYDTDIMVFDHMLSKSSNSAALVVSNPAFVDALAKHYLETFGQTFGPPQLKALENVQAHYFGLAEKLHEKLPKKE